MTKEEFILTTIRPMAEYTFPYIASVIGVEDVDTGKHVGSGLRAILNGRRVLITARHVVEAAVGRPLQFAVSAGYGRPPYRVHGSVQLDPVGDLAVYYLPDDFAADLPDVAFWPEDRIQRSSERLGTDYLFVHGFPQPRSQFLRVVSGIASRSLPYGAMQRLEPAVVGLQAHEFAIEFGATGMRRPDEPGDADFVDPHGLSGSPVWRIGISGRSRAEWKPELSLVVGFVTQWRQDDQVLVATSADRLSAILSGA